MKLWASVINLCQKVPAICQKIANSCPAQFLTLRATSICLTVKIITVKDVIIETFNQWNIQAFFISVNIRCMLRCANDRPGVTDVQRRSVSVCKTFSPHCWTLSRNTSVTLTPCHRSLLSWVSIGRSGTSSHIHWTPSLTWQLLPVSWKLPLPATECRPVASLL